MIKVKVCGITNLEDASMAVSCGAHALGFIFEPSPRRVSPEKARAIIRGISPFVKTVGVFVNERPDTILEVCRFCGLDIIQLHGDESPDLCEALMPHAVKAFHVRDESSLQALESYRNRVRAFLKEIAGKGLAPILIFSPTTPFERMKSLGSLGRGFIYCVSRKGVTGEGTTLSDELAHYLSECRRATPLPLALGFGIKEKSQIDFLKGKAEIAVIGTQTIRVLEQHGIAAVGDFLTNLR